MKSCTVKAIRAWDECTAFVCGFCGDPNFSDPMLSNDEQRENNLIRAIGCPNDHAVIGVFEDRAMIGLFSFLILPDERYIEMLVGLSRIGKAYDAMFGFLETHYPSYHADFVFHPHNVLLRSALEARAADLDTEQQKMVLTSPILTPEDSGVELLTPLYLTAYLGMHGTDMYWTGDRVAEATDRFRTLIAIENRNVVGYLDVTHCFEGNEIYDLFVKENCRRKGHGRKLLCRALAMNQPKGMAVIVDIDNAAAIGLYESVGFEKRSDQNSITARWKIGTPNI